MICSDRLIQLPPHLRTDRIGRKSPTNTIILPLNAKSKEHRSLNVISIHSATCVCAIGASCKSKRVASWMSQASVLCLVMLQTEYTLVGRGIFIWKRQSVLQISTLICPLNFNNRKGLYGSTNLLSSLAPSS